MPRTGIFCARRLRSPCSGFTLVELLLVMLILAVMLTAALPRLGGLTEASRLNAASRTIVMTGRYARTMAILHQLDIDLVIRLEDGRLTVDAAPTGADYLDDDDEGDDLGGELSSRLLDISTNTAVSVSREAVEEIRTERELKKIRVRSVVYTGLEEEELTEGDVRIRYRSNGTCVPHMISIIDGAGDESRNSLMVEIKVDALGSAKVVEEEI